MTKYKITDCGADAMGKILALGPDEVLRRLNTYEELLACARALEQCALDNDANLPSGHEVFKALLKQARQAIARAGGK